ncbi:cellobiose phosphorylase [Bacillus pinisoli]|uniref:cellobiose phosphorylase n=1 Tax=Bacillus pinisoli TaxID=2901866 RepID=UPI001FF323A6|nr:cellobiose phosphorylase [Bacillus pinisoli]
MVNYTFNDENYFAINQYDEAKTFSSFLPGIAGVYGVPMWSFYVNRGQAIVSFGVQDKNHAITEFFPANQAYQRVSTNGFRTFVKMNGKVSEPFSSANFSAERKMFIKENELKIQEDNKETGLNTTVTYFTLPNENFAALVRKVELENHTDSLIELEVVDGLPAIIPFGVDDAAYKAVGNTLKSWMDVFNLENKVPYYRVRSSTNDTAEVEEVTKGHFYLSFVQDGELLSPIVDVEDVFGKNTSWSFPNEFAQVSVKELVEREPITANKVPSGFSAFEQKLAPGEKVTLYTMIGHVNDISLINDRVSDLSQSSYMNQKYLEARELVNEITKDIHTESGLPLFDAYCKQSYLDNVLRGGLPMMLETEGDPFVYYVYSRKHGDLERDYNFFSLAPEFFSQGNGNFRDVNQNRRNDIFFHPEIGDYNIKLFMSLIQADGYNPLVVKGASFELKDKSDVEWVKGTFVSESDQQWIQSKLSGTYTPGSLLQSILERKMELTVAPSEFLKQVLSRSKQNMEAEFGEGYWMDHWTYNLDLIQNYLSIFPEKQDSLLFQDHDYKFFTSHVYVKPRSEKYVVADGKVRQYGAIHENHDGEGNWLVTSNGDLYRTNLMSKLFGLAFIKFSTLDPFGMGIEMEANKPGWNDSMNGLPGLFGSAMSETYELKRVLEFMLDALKQSDHSIAVPVELHPFIVSVNNALEQYRNGSLDDFHYWDSVSSAREQYREAVRNEVSGEEVHFTSNDLVLMLENYLNKVNLGIDKAVIHGEGLTPTYFYFEASDYKVTDRVNEKGLPIAEVHAFHAVPLPHFLEGPARALKTNKSQEESSTIHQLIKESELYDQSLKMYKTSSSLEEMTYEIGRARAFTPGWLERESIFMHMEFKYLLSLLKAGLYDAFFEDFKHALPPFMDPEVYGRSTLENSSFIASSVNPDPAVHGQGFVARLSGTTAEFLSMWQVMMMGKKLFSVNEDQLVLQLQPILPEWLFNDQNQIRFVLLGEVEVTYYNPERKNTFGVDGVKTVKYVLHGNEEKIEVENDFLEEKYALLIRNKEIKKIDVYLG